MKFNAQTLDANKLRQRTAYEAKQIYSKPGPRRGRTYEEIFESTAYGQSAELYLLENDFSDDPRPCKDVIDPNGNPVEVKVTDRLSYVKYVLERATAAKLETWREYNDILYVFIGDKTTLDYYLEGIYEWNGSSFEKA